MREIKFRVWDGGKMLRNHEINGNWLLSGKNAGGWHIMQFTGLKDKNGVDIYEGDILKGLHYVNRIVTYDKGAFHSVAPEKGFTHPLWMSALKKENDLEVIGNIHSNPELLTNG